MIMSKEFITLFTCKREARTMYVQKRIPKNVCKNGWNFLMQTHPIYRGVCQLMPTYETKDVSSKSKL